MVASMITDNLEPKMKLTDSQFEKKLIWMHTLCTPKYFGQQIIDLTHELSE